MLNVIPQLVANNGPAALRTAIADPLRYACEPKVDGVRGLIDYAVGSVETRNRRGERRDWLRGNDFEAEKRGKTGSPAVQIIHRGNRHENQSSAGTLTRTPSDH